MALVLLQTVLLGASPLLLDIIVKITPSILKIRA